ncbi:DNA recombination protein RmuC [Haliea sp. E17]|uniref:DNA recombination protein RmuC n=1 Tax=Haliea sp. E17 TaxID=3401576 RepID=UPI003AAFBAB0
MTLQQFFDNPDYVLALSCTVAGLLGLALGLLWASLRGSRAVSELRAGHETQAQLLHSQLNEAGIRYAGLHAREQQLAQRFEEKAQQLNQLQADFAGLGQRFQSLQNDHTRLQTQQEEKRERHEEQLKLLQEARDNLKQEFEVLANRIFEEKGRNLSASNRESLDLLLRPFKQQITEFQSRINQVHTESVKGQSALEAEIRKVLEVGLAMNTQASNLATALKGDKKTAGNWGEAQLERTLELAGLLPGDHYSGQESFTDAQGKRRMPDFVIKLPDNKSLVIDSKVSLIDYDRAISADSDEERETALAAHAAAVRRHIDDLHAKDYANLPGMVSPDFVLMFMPVEPAYIEALKMNRDLFNYGYQRGVVMVSHTTLMPILRTVANLWRIDQSNREAREISARAGDIYNQVCLVAERLQKLGATLNTASNHYNQTVIGLAGQQGLIGKVERFRQLSSKASKNMVELDPLHADFEVERLQAIELPEAPLENEGETSAPDNGEPENALPESVEADS